MLVWRQPHPIQLRLQGLMSSIPQGIPQGSLVASQKPKSTIDSVVDVIKEEVKDQLKEIIKEILEEQFGITAPEDSSSDDETNVRNLLKWVPRGVCIVLSNRWSCSCTLARRCGNVCCSWRGGTVRGLQG